MIMVMLFKYCPKWEKEIITWHKVRRGCHKLIHSKAVLALKKGNIYSMCYLCSVYECRMFLKKGILNIYSNVFIDKQ